MTSKWIGRATGVCLSLPLSWYFFTREQKQNLATQSLSPEAPATVPRIGQLREDAPFRLVESRKGAEVESQRFLHDGNWHLLYFGFTHCAEICPNTLRYIDGVIDALRNEDEQRSDKTSESLDVRCDFVSVDPNRDTAEKMERFFDRFASKHLRDRYTGYIGSFTDTKNVAKVWKVYFASPEEVDVEENPEYQMDHSCFIFLVSPEGKFMDFFTKDMTVEMAVDKIRLHVDGVYDL